MRVDWIFYRIIVYYYAEAKALKLRQAPFDADRSGAERSMWKKVVCQIDEYRIIGRKGEI